MFVYTISNHLVVEAIQSNSVYETDSLAPIKSYLKPTQGLHDRMNRIKSDN